MTDRNTRVRQDPKGVICRDFVIKTGLGGFLKNQKQRRQLIKIIQQDAIDISRCFIVFSRYLDNRCRREHQREHNAYFVTLGEKNGIRQAFKYFMNNPNIRERRGIDLPSFEGMSQLRDGSARDYGVAVKENLKRNMRRRFFM